jgi:uncharacterized damage-inducible protein DinB
MKNPYAEKIQENEPLPVLAATPARVMDLAKKIDPTKPYAEGKWNAKQIITHLAQCEMMFGTRFRQAATMNNFVVQPFDQDAWMDREPELDFEVAVQGFIALRNFNLALLNSLTDEEKDRPFTHPELGEGNLRMFMKLVAGHDINHLNQLETIAS